VPAGALAGAACAVCGAVIVAWILNFTTLRPSGPLASSVLFRSTFEK
jgi:hypothetical protein